MAIIPTRPEDLHPALHLQDHWEYLLDHVSLTRESLEAFQPPDPLLAGWKAVYLAIFQMIERALDFDPPDALLQRLYDEEAHAQVQAPPPRQARCARAVAVLLLGLSVGLLGCSYAPAEYLGRQLSGLDCRVDKLDAAGRCVPAR